MVSSTVIVHGVSGAHVCRRQERLDCVRAPFTVSLIHLLAYMAYVVTIGSGLLVICTEPSLYPGLRSHECVASSWMETVWVAPYRRCFVR